MATVSFGSFAKRRNSTKQPLTLSDQRTVTLKESCSQDRPILICTGNNFNYNYCSWDGKYYFIDDIVSLKNNLIEIHCVIDVLATYKADILASTQFVSYSSQSGGTWLADTRIPLTQETQTSVSTSLTGILSTIGTYVLTVVGEDGCATYGTSNALVLSQLLHEISTWETDGITSAIQNIVAPSATPALRPPYHAFTSSDDFPEFFTGLCTVLADMCTSLNDTMVSVQDAISTMRSSVEAAAVETGFVGNAYANAPSCIRSCIWVPFDYALAPSGSGALPIKLGTFDTGISGMFPIAGTAATGSNTISIPWHYSDWRRAICEDVYLYLPLVGMVQLSGDSLTNVSSLTIDWSVTYTDGVITYKVLAGSTVIGSYGGQCSANFPLGIAQQASAGEIMNALIGGAEKVVSSIVESSISPVSIGGAIASIGLNVATSAYNVENIKKSTHISCVGGVGGGAGIGLGRDCVCYTVCHPTVISPSDMKDTMGLPTMKPMSLSTLTGYCKCANAHVEALATSFELTELDAYLNSGFYIE